MNKPKVDFDRYTENYNQLLRDTTRFFSKSETYFAKYKVDILRCQVGGSVNRVLEYGCGIGRNIPFLQRAFPEATIVGSDISAMSLEIARAENPDVEVFLEEAGADAGDSFDVIFIAGVFHHVSVIERGAVMEKVRRRLAPGGTIVIFEHNPYNPVTRKIVNNCPYDEHAVLLKPLELKALLSDGGMTVLRSAYCLFIPPSLAVLLPLEGMFSRLPLGGQYWVKATHTV